jgi:hypothetical protein
MNFDEKCM